MSKAPDFIGQRTKRGSQLVILFSFGVLFFMWGLLTNLNSQLVWHLKFIFSLDYSLSTLIGLTFFMAYLFFSLPAANLIKRFGYKRSILTGCLTASAGCFLFYFSVTYRSYWVFLLALMILAGGITILQVTANLYIVLFGRGRLGASRLNFEQAFNSFGTFIAGSFSTVIIWKFIGVSGAREFMDQETRLVTEAAYVHYPYLVMGTLMALFTIYLFMVRIPHIHTEKLEPLNKITSLRRRHVMHFSQLRLGAFAIFAYVGAEVSLANFLVDFASEPDYFLGLSKVDMYWGLMLVGRILAAIYLIKIRPRKAVGYAALVAAFLVTFSIFTFGVQLEGVRVDLWAITLIGICNSLLFPTIFSLGLNGLGKFSIDGAAVMIMSIVGGAVIPFMFRNFSHAEYGYYLAFIIPVICYLYIALYGFRLSKYEKEESVAKEQGEAYEKLEIG